MQLKILDVGQCGVDGPRMTRLFKEKLRATVVNVDTADDALAALEDDTFDIVLVNRVLAADGSSGIDLIGELKDTGKSVPVMLVSDKPDAQQAAIAKGAVQGFGKRVLDQPETLELIRKAAGK